MGTRCPHFLMRVYWVCLRVAVYAGVCACFGRALKPAAARVVCDLHMYFGKDIT